MEMWIHASIHWLLATLALPKVGLSAIFVVSLVSATLLPLGSEPAVFAYAKTVPDMFWPAVLAATVGNTLGGIITYYMGLAAEKAFERWKEKHEHAVAEHGQAASHRLKPAASLQKMGGRWHLTISRWVHRMGPSAMFFSWLPFVGDPLCAVGGWLRLPFWPSVFYMALGKFLRYAAMTAGLLWVFPNLH
ncbi:YqaA family protein [Eoetvoesiella caeni]|nr:YqaA family protein [Eoetvoesiella caeni]MCI2809749.1 DedA family protein [Eoetvoesiella caeni]NYT56336.1 DedA family protein [Eoetvoesiella caeni]